MWNCNWGMASECIICVAAWPYPLLVSTVAESAYYLKGGLDFDWFSCPCWFPLLVLPHMQNLKIATPFCFTVVARTSFIVTHPIAYSKMAVFLSLHFSEINCIGTKLVMRMHSGFNFCANATILIDYLPYLYLDSK